MTTIYEEQDWIAGRSTPQPAHPLLRSPFIRAILAGLPSPSPQPAQMARPFLLKATPVRRSPSGGLIQAVRTNTGNNSREYIGVMPPGIPTAGDPSGRGVAKRGS